MILHFTNKGNVHEIASHLKRKSTGYYISFVKKKCMSLHLSTKEKYIL